MFPNKVTNDVTSTGHSTKLSCSKNPVKEFELVVKYVKFTSESVSIKEHSSPVCLR